MRFACPHAGSSSGACKPYDAAMDATVSASDLSGFALDTPVPVRLNATEYYIAGWFFPTREADALLVEVDGLTAPVITGIPRPDVADHLDNPAALESGFMARLSNLNPTSSIRVLRSSGSATDLLTELGPGLV